jgi:hypothetical protein
MRAGEPIVTALANLPSRRYVSGRAVSDAAALLSVDEFDLLLDLIEADDIAFSFDVKQHEGAASEQVPQDSKHLQTRHVQQTQNAD